MRRFVVSVLAAFGLVVIAAGTASAEPVPETSSAPAAAAGKKMCKVTDEKLDELSGIVATDDGFVVINDSASTESRKRVFYLDTKCKIVDSKTYSGSGPRDTEDLALSPDGKTLWIADIGDNNKERATVGLWSMPLNGSSKPKLHRLTYPDGKRDAEALLLNGDGTPIIVTKETGRPAGLYAPTAALKADSAEGVPMKKVGEVAVPPSDTSANTLARLLRGSVDGGAVALGGSKVALRTYTDALEWDVANGDVVAALKGAPRVTPLPDEHFGEAITYSPDGKYFYTVSDMQGRPEEADNFILRYTPAAKATTAKAAAAGGEGGGDSGGSWFGSLSLNDITYLVGGIGVLGAILVGFGIFGIMRSRKKPLPAEAAASATGGPDPTDAKTELIGVGGPAAARGGTGVYGGNRPAGAASGPGVYGAKPAAAAPAKGSGVYGAGGGRPAQPARPGPGGQPARPGPAGQPPRSPARPGPAGQPVRPAQGQPGRPPQGQPGRPPQGQPARPPQGQPGRPPQGQPARAPQGQPARPAQGGQPGRPAQGQPARPPQGGQPGRPAQGQPPRRPAGGQQPPAGRPPQGGQPGNGVYGAPPANPQGPRGHSGGQGQRPQGNGYGRPPSGGMSNYTDSRGRDHGNPGYRR